MHRGKGYHQAQALKMDFQMKSESFTPRRGTGSRHRVRRWPTSDLTTKSFKLTFPAESPNKKFVFVIGDSHLRAIVDGFVKIHEGCLSFGFLSVPGAKAAELTAEMQRVVLPRVPDAVCLLAPSNNLDGRISDAGKDFKDLLTNVLSLSQKVFVLDFPPRLNHEVSFQNRLRMIYHQVSAEMGVMYSPIADLFPMDCLKLWSRDGVHLSDSDGMKLLMKALWRKAYMYIETSTMSPQVSPRRRSTTHLHPKMDVIGENPIRGQSNQVMGPENMAVKAASRPLHSFEPGQWVLITDLRYKHRMTKWWVGPYQILLVTNTAVKVAERMSWIHCSHCKRFTSTPPLEGPESSDSRTPEP